VLGQLRVLVRSVRTCRDIACDDHDFAGCLIDGLIEVVPSPMAAKFQVEISEPRKTLDVVFGHLIL
jgi:hypothetical protein